MAHKNDAKELIDVFPSRIALLSRMFVLNGGRTYEGAHEPFYILIQALFLTFLASPTSILFRLLLTSDDSIDIALPHSSVWE